MINAVGSSSMGLVQNKLPIEWEKAPTFFPSIEETLEKQRAEKMEARYNELKNKPASELMFFEKLELAYYEHIKTAVKYGLDIDPVMY